MTVADRLLTGDLNIPRESAMTFLENIVFSGKIKFDPSKNDFPVTLHDPCNIVRNLGIVEPQRRILRYLCPQFREMTPHGVDNYCCGGGGGLSVMSNVNFTGLEGECGRPDEVQTGAGGLRRPARAGGKEIRLRAVP